METSLDVVPCLWLRIKIQNMFFQTHSWLPKRYLCKFSLSLNLKRISTLSFPGGSEDKASACSAGDLGSIPGLGRSPGEGNGNPLQYSCLENPMDRGAWRATVHGVAKSRTRLSNFTLLSNLGKLRGMISFSKQPLISVTNRYKSMPSWYSYDERCLNQHKIFIIYDSRAKS